MGKPKKGKKGRQDDDFGDDEVDVDPLAQVAQEEEAPSAAKPAASKGKKGKKKKNDDWEDDVSAEIAALALQQDANHDGADVNGGIEEEVLPQQKSKKKKKGKKAAESSDEDEDLREDTMDAADDGGHQFKSSASKLPKKGAGMSAFSMLMDDDDDDSPENASSDDEPVQKPAKKEKDKKIKNQASTEDEQNLENGEEEKAPQLQQQQSKKKGKKEKKKKKDDEDIDALLAEIEGKMAPDKGIDFKDISSMTQEEIAKAMEDEYDDEDDKKKKKKKKGKGDTEAKEQKDKEGAPKEEGDEAEDDDDDLDEEEGSTVKTAAQKKKEKKERQKQKKLEEKSKDKKSKKNKTTTEDNKEVSTQEKMDTDVAKGSTSAAATDTAETPGGGTEESGEKPAEDKEEDGEKEDKKKSKKDKKKKKEKEKEEEPKKKPTSKMAKMILEQQRKIQEEEERIRKEMEEKERQIQEAIRIQEEAERKVKEKKEKEKQKKRDRIERQKKEGTFLTAKQKEDKKRAQAMLEAMKAQGYEIAADKEEAPKKKRPVYDNKKKKKPQQQSSQEDKEVKIEEVAPIAEVKPDITPKTEVVVKDKKAESQVKDAWDAEQEEEGIKDSWDVSDDEKEEKVEEKTDKKEVTKKKSRTSESSSTKSKSDAESGEEEHDDSEDEEESSEEQESSEEDSDDESSSDEEDGLTLAEKARNKALARIQKRKDDAEKKKTTDVLRAAVVVVLGHVDTGKTKILDKLRRTNVQDNEAGGITQQIGATNVPVEAIKDATKMCKEFSKAELKLPGLLIIDTPGHESFSNLRSRGSSLCDIAILVVDIMHGLEPQTIESINLLKERKTPFLVALNKIDRLYQWQSNPHSDVINVIKKQKPNTKIEFEERASQTIVQLAEQGLNAKLFYENKNPKEYISLVPTSAHTGDGMGNLIALICELTQNYLAKHLAYSEELHATVMEVKSLPGLGTTIDVILVNGKVNEGDTIIVPGSEGPIVTQIRGILMPQPMRELRVKNAYVHHKSVQAAQGVKLIAKDLDKALAGLPVYIAHMADEIDIYKEELSQALEDILSAIKLSEKGVFVQASTLGSLEALLQFLKDSKIAYAGINIGPVHKRDVMKLSVMLDRDPQYAVLLAFDVKIERDAQELADNLGIRIFSAEIIYHLFDAFMAYRDEYKKSKQEEFKNIAVFPCKLRVLPDHVYNTRDPIVMGVSVETGFLKMGTPLCVPSKEFTHVGVVTSIEINHKNIDKATKGQDVCIKIENIPGETPKLYGRHFDHTDHLVSKISRESIDAVKNYFRDEMTKTDWQLIVELKKLFEIL